MQLADSVRTDILKALQQDRLELPVLPEVALRIRDTADNPNVTVGQLAKVIGEDPALSARVIRVANSPLLRGPRVIEDLASAINRLGITFSANLATGFAMEQMFQSTSETIDELLRAVWNHATQVAAISTTLARTRTRLKPDQAMLAGLTHAIGILPVLAWAENDDRLTDDPALLNEVIEQVHPELGSAILRSWEFPGELIEVPRKYAQLDRTTPRADYVDVVAVANITSRLGTAHPLAKVDLHDVAALARLGFDPDTAADALAQVVSDGAVTLH
jgi:HD-like signal output (HDOD) protein